MTAFGEDQDRNKGHKVVLFFTSVYDCRYPGVFLFWIYTASLHSFRAVLEKGGFFF